MKRFARCSCYFTDNIFIPSLKMHVTYDNHEQFVSDYGHLIEKEPKLEKTVQAEIDRRNKFTNEISERKEIISRNYLRLHPGIFNFETKFLDPEFVETVLNCDKDFPNFREKYGISNPKFELYQFPVFTREFCENLLAEMENYHKSDLPKEKPNTMNNYGLLLDEVGFSNFFSDFRSQYLNSICKALFPDWTGCELDSHRAFTVQYSPTKDKDLSLHFDNAEVTINISLSDCKIYEGGEVFFLGVNSEGPPSNMTGTLPLHHKQGYGILHRGRQYHAALPVTKGIRTNLIMWMRSSSIRNEKCAMCNSKPDLIPVNLPGNFGDGFVIEDNSVDVCNLL